jgi:hypothetical protein
LTPSFPRSIVGSRRIDGGELMCEPLGTGGASLCRD